MVNNEWALIFYTLLIQTAVGAYLISFILNNKLKKHIGEEKAFELIIPAQYITGVIAVAGLVVSLFHLGTPFKAGNSLLNLGSSWLSREILLTGAFIILWLVTVLLARKAKKLSSILVIATSLIGLADIYCMSKIYSTTLIPAWQGLHTFVVFYATCFILGSLVTVGALAFVMNKQRVSEQNMLLTGILTPVSFIVLIALAIQVIIVPNYIAALASGNGAGQASAQLLSGQFGFVMVLRWVLAFLGVFVLIYAVWKQLPKAGTYIGQQQGYTEMAAAGEYGVGQAVSPNLVYIAFVIMAAGEVIGRYLFYASGVQITLGLL